MMFIKIITDLLCGALNFWGGYSNHNARRFIMPVLLAVNASICAHVWWVGLLVLPVIGTLCLGYKNFGSGNLSRALWLFIQSVTIGLGLTITGHLAWFVYIPYITLAGVFGGIYKNWWQPLGDFIAGILLGSIIFFVR